MKSSEIVKIETKIDSPGVIAPPPFIYLGGLAVGGFLHWLKPMPLLSENLTLPFGILIIAVSVLLVISSFREFKKAKTNIDVRKPTTSIVSSGPYRFTRNPIYVSMTLLTLGIALWINTLWILITLIPVLLVMQFGVIVREEAYLTKKFGNEYLAYQSKVHRWI